MIVTIKDKFINFLSYLPIESHNVKHFYIYYEHNLEEAILETKRVIRDKMREEY